MHRPEEDIKVKVIVAWLHSLGFSEDELSFEQRLIAQTENNRIQNRFLDILVKRDGRHLFVIEVKNDEKKLTDRDRDQAVQYARMLKPNPPIAIVTNGISSKMFNVLDSREIMAEEDAHGYALGLEDIANIYDNVFKHFISFTSENVKTFCEAQTRKEMKTLVGSREDRNKKYIPELYVPSKKSINAVNDFLKSEKSVFAFIGESGSGKTCVMCDLARQLSDERHVLFYRAVHLTDSIEEKITADFNWQFSTQRDIAPLFKRLSELSQEQELVIFVDAVDEWSLPTKVEHLGNFAARIRNKNIKLIISCKSGQWSRFVGISGVQTALSQEVYPTQGGRIGYHIGPFENEELYGPAGLIQKYRDFYEFHGAFESEVLEECKKSPFMLRVFFEVAYRNKDKCPNLTFSIRDFYDEYYFKAVQERMPDHKDEALYVLKEIARLQYDMNCDAIDLEVLRKEGLGMTAESILSALYDANILERIQNGLSVTVRFYFQKLRDYIIAFGVRRWDAVSIDQFKKDCESITFNDVQRDAIAFFYPFAEFERKKILDGPVRANAEAYLTLYQNVLDEQFPNLRHRFAPQTTGRIGFVGTFNIRSRRVGAYGFRAIKDTDENVIFVLDDEGFWSDKPNEIYLLGASRVHYRSACNGFIGFDLRREVLKGEVEDQLKEIISSGLLNETENYHLNIEKVVGFVAEKQANLHGIKDRQRLSQYLPIAIDKIEYGLRRHKAQAHYWNQLVQEKLKQGTIKMNWNGTMVSYSVSLTNEEKATIDRQAEDAATAGVDFDTNDVDFKKINQVLKEALSTLKARSPLIDTAILPDQDRLPTRGHECKQYQKETVGPFVKNFYSIFLEEYKTLVEVNFPTLKAHFSLYAKLPIHYFIVVTDDHEEFSARLYECINAEGNEVTLCGDADVAFDWDAFILTHNGKHYKVDRIHGNALAMFSGDRYLPYYVPSEFTVLRGFVYRHISDELPAVMKQLQIIYGVQAGNI